MGATHWIERNVVRIGSEPSSDMVIPSSGVDAHALTVEFRQIEYRVYNRSSAQVIIGGRLLEPGQFMPWMDSDLLQMQSNVTLALELDSDPRPAPKPILDASEDLQKNLASLKEATDTPHPQVVQAVSDLTAETPAGLSKSTLQWAVTVLCVLGCVLLLVRQQYRSDSEPGQAAPKFESVVRIAIESEDQAVGGLVDRLQLAEAAFVRKQTAIARERFRDLHDSLEAGKSQAANLHQTPSPNLQPSTSESPSPSDGFQSNDSTIANPTQLMQQFVEHRLRQIGS